MNLQYVKRYRMRLELAGWQPPPLELPLGYRLVAWQPTLLEEHAEVKYLSFRDEVDAQVFPCLGELAGCQRLMQEIQHREGFLPAATWLAEYVISPGSAVRPEQTESCGTIQAVRSQVGQASIQNIGVVPVHRGRGLGTALISAALRGLKQMQLHQVQLEVTAENDGAVRLYSQLGFHTVRTLYKAVELAHSLPAH